MYSTVSGSPWRQTPADHPRGGLDPVTIEMMQKYGMIPDKHRSTLQSTPRAETHKGLDEFIDKYHLKSPAMQIKSGFTIGRNGPHEDSLIKTPSTVSIDLTITASLSSSHSGEGSQELWKVKTNGSFLGSTSFNSCASNDVGSNPTELLKKFKLKTPEIEETSSTSTEKITNHGSRYEAPRSKAYSYIGSFANSPYFQAKLKNRLSKVGAETLASLQNMHFKPISSAESSVASLQSKCSQDMVDAAKAQTKEMDKYDSELVSQKKEFTRDSLGSVQRIKSMSDFEEETSYLTGFASLHIGMPLVDADATTVASPKNEAMSTHQEESTVFSESDVESYMHPAATETTTRSSDNVSYDESEFNKMADVTFTYQKFDSENTKQGTAVSAIPMEGIGVDLRNDYARDGSLARAATPREASGAACNFSSVVGNYLFGVESKRKQSPLDFMVR